jgi:cell filamentation protein
MTDPYVYPGTRVLRNKENIRHGAELARFERLMTAQRLREGLPAVGLTADGFRALHFHIFQDVYEWAGRDRTIEIAKADSLFCLPQFIVPELERRFAAIRMGRPSNWLAPVVFAEHAALHISELNAIHPFREGNGRTARAFLVVLGQHAGHRIEIQRFEPVAWIEASRESFRTGDCGLMRAVIAGAIVS